MSRIALFIPCFIDQFRPGVGMATTKILERLGYDVVYPEGQTCCGQPFFNGGFCEDAAGLAGRFIEVFGAFDHIVSPSASCVSFVRHGFRDVLEKSDDAADIAGRTRELCEFLTENGHASSIDVSFPYRVGLQPGCHGQRELRLAQSSELSGGGGEDRVRGLLERVDGLTLVSPARTDECCGFGGSFSVMEDAVSCSMGSDRLQEQVEAGAEVLTGTDVSCLLHLEGLARRQGRPLRFLHVAEILAGVEGLAP